MTDTGHTSASDDLRQFLGADRFATVMADPPWRITNRTGKVAPERKRLDAGRNGGCPVLAVGITPRCVSGET